MARQHPLAPLAIALLAAAPLTAGEADVRGVEVRCDEETRCDIAVTVEHADEGWEHYADRWEVLDPQGEVLAVRVLRHPHVLEQPFTRKLEGVEIPEELTEIVVRVHDSIHGYGGIEVTVELPGDAVDADPEGESPSASSAPADGGRTSVS